MPVITDQGPTGQGLDNWIAVVPDNPSTWEVLDEPIGAPDTADYVEPSSGVWSEITWPDLPGSAVEVTDITVSGHVRHTVKTPDVSVVFRQSGGADLATKILTVTPDWTTASVTWSGLAMPAAEFNGHLVRFRQSGLGTAQIATLAMTVTYTDAGGNTWYLTERRRRIQP